MKKSSEVYLQSRDSAAPCAASVIARHQHCPIGWERITGTKARVYERI